MVESPYMGAIAAHIKLEATSSVLTFESDGNVLRYNDAFLERLSDDELLFVLANGAMHTLLHHQERGVGKTAWLWQKASDYVINAMLVKNGFALPQYAPYEERFADLYAEEVYDLLRSELQDEGFSAEQQTEQIRHDESVHNEKVRAHKEQALDSNAHEMRPSELQELSEEIEASLKEQLEQLFHKYDRQGELPEGLERLVPELFASKVDWRTVLAAYFDRYAKHTHRFLPPSTKMLYRGIYLPSLTSERLHVAIAIDTSGSIDEALLGRFLGEVEAIMATIPDYEIEMLCFDTRIRSHDTFLPGDRLTYRLKGGGGTDFRVVFEYIERYLPETKLLLFFTDLAGTFPVQSPLYETLWVSKETRVAVPFGRLLPIEG